MQIKIENIPVCLKALPQWVLWKTAARSAGDKPTKLPFQVSGAMAKADDPKTWNTLDVVWQAFERGGYSGIGFEFSATDPYWGIDLDGCRNPETGEVALWAKDVINAFKSYAEVSPSRTGIKVFTTGKPFATGKKQLPDAPQMCEKMPGIEVYCERRYFAVTGWRLKGLAEIREDAVATRWLKDTFFPEEPALNAPPQDWNSDDAVVQRARKYLAKMPPAISGQDGSGRTFHAACVLVLGFSLSESDAYNLLCEFNETCQPRWTEKELRHKLAGAAKQPGQRGYLRNSAPERWGQIPVPQYQEPAPVSEPRITTLVDAARGYIESLQSGPNLIGTSIPDLDYAVGGGFERGEMVILGARPSHGKSAFGLQACHGWASAGLPCLVISEEMGARMLGRRTLQFATPLPQEHWRDQLEELELTLAEYARSHQKTIVVEGCGKIEVAAQLIEKHVKEDGVQCVVIDYAQLLGSGKGKNRYEQITNVSIGLRQIASAQKLVMLVLCQLGRSIESRSGEWIPVMADLKESGSLEQDADVILFGCWPCRNNVTEPPNKYLIHVCKNRNRAINQANVICHFEPSRQMITDSKAEQTRIANIFG